MKKKKIKIKKKTIVIIIVLILVLIGIIVLVNKKPKDNLKYNTNKTFVKNQKVEGIVFKNIKCTYDGKNSLISYTMVNKTKNKIYLKNYDVIVKDKNNNKLTRITANVTQSLSPKESVDMANEVVGVDLTNAYYMELKLNTNKKEE